MVILDTDHVTLFFAGGPAGSHIKRRLDVLPQGEIATTVVTYEEQSRGWLAYLSKSARVSHVVDAYRRLQHHIESFKAMPVVGFADAAAIEFQRLRKLGVRIGTMDLRIASIALTLGATVLSRNMRDFRQVPGLTVEDWSSP